MNSLVYIDFLLFAIQSRAYSGKIYIAFKGTVKLIYFYCGSNLRNLKRFTPNKTTLYSVDCCENEI